MGDAPTTLPERRAAFAAHDADRLAARLGELRRMPPRGGWTKRAVWYEDGDVLTAVVGEQEGADAGLVLAHGLHHRGSRLLRLVLPEVWSHATRQRIAFLDDRVELAVHDDAGDVSPLDRLSPQQAVRRLAPGKTAAPSLYLGAADELVRRLVFWACSHPDLVPAHTSTTRSWSHRGIRVLAITGTRAREIRAGVDSQGTAYSVKAPGLTPDTLTELQRAVDNGVSQVQSTYAGRFEEHHLQVVLRQQPSLLGLEEPVIREVPAWRPAGGEVGFGTARGFIDLLGLDAAGDVVLVETKLGSDDMLVLQGLDYYAWATNTQNWAWLTQRLNASPKAQLKLLYTVGGKGGGKASFSRYGEAQLNAVRPEVPWRFALVEDWNGDRPRVVVGDPGQHPSAIEFRA